MFRWALRKGIDKLEREWNYDASHICDTVDASPRAASPLAEGISAETPVVRRAGPTWTITTAPTNALARKRAGNVVD